MILLLSNGIVRRVTLFYSLPSFYLTGTTSITRPFGPKQGVAASGDYE